MDRRLVLAVRPDEKNRRGENGKDLLVTLKEFSRSTILV
jgi:hypothetical protein